MYKESQNLNWKYDKTAKMYECDHGAFLIELLGESYRLRIKYLGCKRAKYLNFSRLWSAKKVAQLLIEG